MGGMCPDTIPVAVCHARKVPRPYAVQRSLRRRAHGSIWTPLGEDGDRHGASGSHERRCSMDETAQKVIADSEKVSALAKTLDDKLASFYPVDWQRESLDQIQNLCLILLDEVKILCEDAEKLGRSKK